MTEEHKYIMYLYSCGVRGISAEPPQFTADWERILNTAAHHSVRLMIASVLKKADFCPPEIKTRLFELSVGTAINNAKKADALIQLLAALKAEGFHPAILKGLDVARFYCYPECRNSADSDVFIPLNEEKQVIEYLKKNGFDVSERKKDDNHSKVHRNDVGLIELHTYLFNNENHIAIFGKDSGYRRQTQKFAEVSFKDSTITVLHPQDGIMFMATHMSKHFIMTGISIRTAFDFALYYSKVSGEIDAERFWDTMKQLDLYVLLQTILSGFVLYGCFNESDFPQLQMRTADECDAVFDYIMSYSGEDEIDYKAWEYYYYNHVSEGGGLKLKLRKIGHWLAYYKIHLFPDINSLSKQFSYLKNKRYLYPVACIHHIIKGLSNKKMRDNAKNHITVRRKAQAETTENAVENKIKLLGDLQLLKK